MKLRKILAVVLAMALLCATFAACGNDAGTSTSSGTTSSTSSSGESKTETASTGDVTLNLRNAMEPTSLNTLLATYAYDFQVINALYECLYELDENDVPQPAAAESVDISEDKLVYTFHLRQDGTWSNGDPVTANDFACAFGARCKRCMKICQEEQPPEFTISEGHVASCWLLHPDCPSAEERGEKDVD